MRVQHWHRALLRHSFFKRGTDQGPGRGLHAGTGGTRGPKRRHRIQPSAALAARHAIAIAPRLASRLCPLLHPCPAFPSPPSPPSPLSSLSSPHAPLLRPLSPCSPSTRSPSTSLKGQWYTLGTPIMASLGAVHRVVERVMHTPAHCSPDVRGHGATQHYAVVGHPGSPAGNASAAHATAVTAVTAPGRPPAALRFRGPGPAARQSQVTSSPLGCVTVRSLASDTVTEGTAALDTVTGAAPGAEGVFPGELPKAFDFSAEPKIYQW